MNTCIRSLGSFGSEVVVTITDTLPCSMENPDLERHYEQHTLFIYLSLPRCLQCDVGFLKNTVLVDYYTTDASLDFIIFYSRPKAALL